MTKSVIDTSDLEVSLIGRKECTRLGTRDSKKVDTDFIIGIGSDYGYTKDNCETSKRDLYSRNILNCTFNPDNSTSDVSRCSPRESVRYYRSFLDSDNSDTDRIKVVTPSDSLKKRYDKECPQECVVDR